MSEIYSWDLSPQQRADADELIKELQDRLNRLRELKDGSVTEDQGKNSPFAGNWSPINTLIEVGPRRVVISERQNRVTVTINGATAISLTGTNLDSIDFEAMTEALIGLRERLVLEDLANI